MKKSFNRKYFIQMLNDMRPRVALNPHSCVKRYKDIGLRKWAKLIGVAPATLSRATRRGTVDLNSAIRICAWMGKPVDDFVKTRGKKPLTPSVLTIYPWDSIFKKAEYEFVAYNIMVILKRNGNRFKPLDWDAYMKERKKDKGFSEYEHEYFVDLAYLSMGDRQELERFSPVWKEAINKLNPK